MSKASRRDIGNESLESEVQKQIIEKLSKDVKSLHEEKEKIESELVGKESEVQLIQAQFAKEIFRLNDIIGKLRKLCWRYWNKKLSKLNRRDIGNNEWICGV